MQIPSPNPWFKSPYFSWGSSISFFVSSSQTLVSNTPFLSPSGLSLPTLLLPLLHNSCSHHLVLIISVSQLCVPISLPSVSLYLIPPTVSQILFLGVFLPISCSHFCNPHPCPVQESSNPHFGSYFPKFKYLFPHQATVLLLGSMIFPGGQEIRDEEAGRGRQRLLTEGLGMPERLTDVEGWDRDLLGSKDLNEGGGSTPGFCWAVANPGWGNVERKVAQ